ncbi:MAG: glycosyltransferase [Thermoanaerobaculia bacterium]
MTSSRLRVLVVTGSLPPAWCGVGDHAARLTEAMARRGADVGVLTTEGQPDSPDVEVIRTPDWRLRRVGSLLRKIRAFRPDVVHFQYPAKGYRNHLAPWVLPALCAAAGMTVVMTWHEPLEPRQLWIYLNVMVPTGVVLVRPRSLDEVSRLLKALMRWKTFRLIEIGSTIPFIAMSAGERAQVHREFASDAERLVAYFGFAFPHKGVEQMFEIADPQRDALLIIGDLREDDAYQRGIRQLATGERWAGRCLITGPVSSDRAAVLLGAADAVVLPFVSGAGTWNSSMRAAVGQGTFVLTTSPERSGYDEAQNIYYAKPGAIPEMQAALRQYAGHRGRADSEAFVREWDAIAAQHIEFYQDLLARRRPRQNQPRST